MNILYVLKLTPHIIGEVLIVIADMLLSVIGFLFILPFCRHEDTIGAEYKWFAWHPVLISGDDYCFNVINTLKRFRWLVFVGRKFSFDGPIYEDLKEN